MTTNEKIGVGLAIVGGILASISVVLYGWHGWNGTQISRHEKALHVVVLCSWIVLPPIWFAIEPYLAKGVDPEVLKKKQESFSRMWLGVSAMLGVLAQMLKP